MCMVHQIWLKILIFNWRKWQKNHFFGKKILKKAKKKKFELNMLKLLENHIETKLWEGFSLFF